MRGSSRLLLIFFFLLVSSIKTSAFKTHTIYWNASNPLFKDGDYEISVRLGDRLSIVCPLVGEKESEEDAFMVINKDSEMAHMNCVLETPKTVVRCDNPRRDPPIRSNNLIKRYQTHKLGLEWEPGMTHYLLSTSRGDQDGYGMSKTTGGLCQYEKMRMKIVVEEFDPSTVIDTTRAPPTTVPPLPDSLFSVPVHHPKETGRRFPHEQRRHTKKEREHEEAKVDSTLENTFSESENTAFYTYHTASDEAMETPSSGWESLRMPAEDMGGDIKAPYRVSSPDYIISEHSSSAAFSFVLLSIIVLLSLR